MRKHSILQAPFLAFYSEELYRDVAGSWRGASFVYLLLLLVVCWLPMAFAVHDQVRTFVKDEGAYLVDQIPSITIRQGAVSSDVPQPYYIKDKAAGRVLAIIDTTGQVATLSGSGAWVLLGKEQVSLRSKPNEVRTYELSRIESFQIDSTMARLWLDWLRRWAALFLYSLALAGSYLYRIIAALILAAIGVPLARGLRAELGYGALVNIAIVAMTPVILGKTILEAARIHVPFSWLVFMGISIAYLAFGIKANGRGVMSPPDGAGPSTG